MTMDTSCFLRVLNLRRILFVFLAWHVHRCLSAPSRVPAHWYVPPEGDDQLSSDNGKVTCTLASGYLPSCIFSALPKQVLFLLLTIFQSHSETLLLLHFQIPRRLRFPVMMQPLQNCRLHYYPVYFLFFRNRYSSFFLRSSSRPRRL